MDNIPTRYSAPITDAEVVSDGIAPIVMDDEELLTKVTKQVEYWNRLTTTARELSNKCRDYKDGYQWTDGEVATLRSRKQAPIVVNRIKPKIEGLLGLLQTRKTEPKAYPRTQKHEEAARAATDALRYVAEANDFHDTVKMPVADEFFVEGTGAAIIDIEETAKGIEIKVKHIPYNRFYFDPDSIRKDFEDARFKGYTQYLDEDQIMELFPEADFDEMVSASNRLYIPGNDHLQWCNSTKKRAMICVHFFIYKTKWHFCVFNSGQFLVAPQLSPYLDDCGLPMCPIEAVSAFIDREGNRYGEVASYLDPQDEINHRRSKALHLLNSRQTKGKKGAVDVAKTKAELRKPDGHIEVMGDNADFEIITTSDMVSGQFEIYKDSKGELDAVGFNAQLAGERQNGDLSGVAINKLQMAGTIEINPILSSLSGWEKRVYRQIWARVKQYWNEEIWIRVTDDQDNLKWVGLNHQVTAREHMEDIINDKSVPDNIKKPIAASYVFLTGAEQQGLPGAKEQLEAVITVKNDTNELDVDIIIEQSLDFINNSQEQFQLLTQLYQPGAGIDIVDIIKVSELRGKDALIDSIKKNREAQAEAGNSALQLEQQAGQAKIAETVSKAKVNEQKAVQTGIENEILVSQPHHVTSVAV